MQVNYPQSKEPLKKFGSKAPSNSSEHSSLTGANGMQIIFCVRLLERQLQMCGGRVALQADFLS